MRAPHRLSLEWNSLGLARTGISALSSAIASNRSLKEVHQLLSSLSRNYRHTQMLSSSQQLRAPLIRRAENIARLFFGKSSWPEQVDLRSNRIGPSTAAALAHALRSNFSLTCLGTSRFHCLHLFPPLLGIGGSKTVSVQ